MEHPSWGCFGEKWGVEYIYSLYWIYLPVYLAKYNLLQLIVLVCIKYSVQSNDVIPYLIILYSLRDGLICSKCSQTVSS